MCLPFMSPKTINGYGLKKGYLVYFDFSVFDKKQF